MNETQPAKRKPGRPRKQFEVRITMVPVPLPPEKRWEYEEAWRLIGEMMRKASASLRLEAEGCASTQTPGDQGERFSQ